LKTLPNSWLKNTDIMTNPIIREAEVKNTTGWISRLSLWLRDCFLFLISNLLMSRCRYLRTIY
jgi:hypothetical protein